MTNRALRLAEALGAPVLALALLVAKAYRKYAGFGRHDAPIARRLYHWLGIYPVMDHFYEPWPTSPEPGRRHLPGLHIDLDDQVTLLRTFDPTGFDIDLADNGQYSHGDADLLWHVVRANRPSTIVEVGSGYSTHIIASAGTAARHVAIDPQPRTDISGLGVEVIRRPVQEVDLALFRELGEGDILFIDSSHVIRPRGDVLHLYLTVLPLLPPGVLVHVHDIFTPWDYPSHWVDREMRLWDEQYLLEGMLSSGGRYGPVLSAHALWRERRPEMERACPSTIGRNLAPSSFWFKVKHPS